MDKIEQLKMVYKSYIDTEEEIRGKIFSEENGEYFFIPSFEGNAIVHAIYGLYIDQDYLKSKRFFYKAA